MIKPNNYKYCGFPYGQPRGMLLHMGVFGQADPGPQGLKQPIKEAFANFTAWRRRHKIQCSHRPFSYKSIFKDEYGCYLNAKGFNARLICQWLLDVILWVKTQPDVILNTDDRLDVTEQCLKLGFQFGIRFVLLSSRHWGLNLC